MASIKMRRVFLDNKGLIFVLGALFLIIAVAIGFSLNLVEEGDTVQMNYTLTLDDGTIYYTTAGKVPLHVTLGEGILLASLEEVLIGMRAGETRSLTIPVEQAYGPYRVDLIQVIERDQLPDGVQPPIGQQFDAELLDGSSTVAIVTAVTDRTITLDANHPLAGQNLNFEINLLSINGNAGLVDPKKTLIGWIVLTGAGSFMFLIIRNREDQTVFRRLGLSYRAASTGYRKR